MILPHSSNFAWRRAIFWSFCIASFALAARRTELADRALLLALLASAALALALYFYSRWLARLEARFRSVHPRKYRMTTLLMFYGCSGAALLLVALSPWLTSWWVDSPLGAATGYFVAPALMASAAGFLWPTQQGESAA
jgi:hypothetical protein